MRIAITGSSSTGKTTVVNDLLADPRAISYFDRRLNVDARSLLKEMGHHSMDRMDRDARLSFQREYFRRKLSIEEGQDSYITERSFVDIAAYWCVRENPTHPQLHIELLRPCFVASQRYDLHFYAPSGLIPFESDGYRSEDSTEHDSIGKEIWSLLERWKLPVIRLDYIDRSARVELVFSHLSRLMAG